ncbi:hypothetical protein ADZ37_09555 [Pannonibacter phragmitetus]|nr:MULTISPECIES: DUF2164 domain-containing protein [Pannonibacter]KND19474.1 hypothetical protein ADZ37_09555 [Pannonibacter phragmitetus]
MKKLELPRDLQTRIASRLSDFCRDELDVDLGNMDALRLLDFLAEEAGSAFYTLGVRDAAAQAAKRFEDLSDDLAGLERQDWR